MASPPASLASPPATPEHEYLPPRERWIVAAAVMSAAVMELLDTSVVNVSLPHIAGNLSATVDQSTWILTSYLVANAIVLPIAGWLASRIGRRRLLLSAILGFTGASFLCGIAPTLPLLVCFRVLQGLSGGSLQPLSRAILLETFPREKRGQAMSLWGAGIVTAPILAPALGGWLTTDFSWRWVFFINLPVGLFSLLMISLFIHDPAYLRRRGGKIDGWGLGMLAIGIAALQIMLDKGQQDDWFGSHFILALAIVAAVMLAAFILRQLRVAHPLVHLQLFRYRSFAVGATLGAVLGFVLFGSLVLLPLYMQTLLGFDPIQAGFWTSPRGLGSLFFMPIAGLLIGKGFDQRKLLLGGFVAAGIGLLMFSHMNLQTGVWDLFWPQIVMGSALAFTFVPMSTMTVDPIPNPEMGYATSITSLLRNLGASVGISFTTTLLDRRQQFHQVRLAAGLSPQNPLLRQRLALLGNLFRRYGVPPAAAHQRALALFYSGLQRQATLLSYLDDFHFLALVFFIVSPLVFLMRRTHYGKSPAPAEE